MRLKKSDWANFKQTWQKSLFGKLGIQVCSNKGPLPFSRGENNEIVKKNIDVIKSSYPKPTGPISTKLGKNRCLVNGKNKGPRLFLRGDNNEIVRQH